MKIETTTKNVLNYMSCSDITVIQHLYKDFEEKGSIDLNGVQLAKDIGLSRASVTNSIKLLQVLGIVSTQSMGMKGTRVRLENEEALKILSKG